jgi:putrescine transport system substrate-binding protein
MRRILLALLAALISPLALLGTTARAQPVLNVYNWTDYIDPSAIERFQAETGIRLRYDVFDSLETLEGKLSAGRSGYDVVVPTNEPTLSRLVRAGALLPLDRSRIPNWQNLDPALMQRVETSDPGNRHGVIYLWGTIGLGLRADRVRELAPDAPLDSLALLMDPRHASRLASCGIAVMDSATDVLPSVLRYLGRSPDSMEAADLRAAEQALLAIRPHVRSIPPSASVLDALAAGEVCVGFTYSGDVIQAAARAREAKADFTISYVAPKEGAQLWFDMLAIPADAPNPEAAHAFINFLLQPQVMAGITNQVRYPNAVPAARPMVVPEVRDDPNVYPPAERIAQTFTVSSPEAQQERTRARLWSRFKARR